MEILHHDAKFSISVSHKELLCISLFRLLKQTIVIENVHNLYFDREYVQIYSSSF
jgi:hypothetical protein